MLQMSHMLLWNILQTIVWLQQVKNHCDLPAQQTKKMHGWLCLFVFITVLQVGLVTQLNGRMTKHANLYVPRFADAAFCAGASMHAWLTLICCLQGGSWKRFRVNLPEHQCQSQGNAARP